MIMKYVTGLPDHIRKTTRFVSGARPGAPFADLHRSIGLPLLGLEGYSRPQESHYFRQLIIERPEIQSVLEIGFNAGHSSYVFLDARPDVRVVSFDLGEHGYVRRAKRFIDAKFPGRHELVLGDSTVTVPRYRAEHPDALFDLAFVDGGHDYSVASADLRNCRELACPDGLVIMDDLLEWTAWGTGPARAWAEACNEGIVTAIELVQDGQRVTSVNRKASTGAWALGRYSQ